MQELYFWVPVIQRPLGSLSNNNGYSNENGHWRSNRFIVAKHHASRFFVHFLAVFAHLQHESACNFMFCRGWEHKTKTSYFFSWTFIQSFRIQLKFANIWWIKQDGISAIKFEAAWVHFLSDVFVAVALVVA